MQDVFKLKAEKYRSCKFWNCFENAGDDKRIARRAGRHALRQQDEREFKEEMAYDLNAENHLLR